MGGILKKQYMYLENFFQNKAHLVISVDNFIFGTLYNSNINNIYFDMKTFVIYNLM